MIRKLLLTGLLATSLIGKTLACSCFPVGYHFCETIQNDPSIASIVMVKKMFNFFYGMNVQVLQNIAGEPTESTITIWGDNGGLCRLGLGWNNDDTIIMAIHHSDLGGNIIYNPDYPPDLEDSLDYHVSGCGVYALSVNNGMVSGFIDAQAFQSMSLNTFLSLPCLQTLGQENYNLGAVNLYPNPAQDCIRFGNSTDILTGLNVVITNSLGQIIFQANEFTLDGSINIQHLAKGAYTLVLYNEEHRRSFCFIKQ